MGQPISQRLGRFVLRVLLALVGCGLVVALSKAKAPHDTAHEALNRAQFASATSEDLTVGHRSQKCLRFYVKTMRQNNDLEQCADSLSATGAPGDNAKPAIQNDVSATKTVKLQRVEPRAPLSAMAAPTPPPPTAAKDLPKRWRPVGNGFASAAGIVQVGTFSITLEGLDTLAADDICTAPSGEVWPCGMVARTAFRAFLRSRTLNCDLPDGLIDTAISAECLLAGEDPAGWLVQNGWARANPTGPYGGEGDHAKASRVGIYGNPPR